MPLVEWLPAYLFPEGFFDRNAFPSYRVLARRTLHWPLLEGILHETQIPVRFTRADLYREVMKACGLLKLTRSGSWFQFNVHDNCNPILEGLGEYPSPLKAKIVPLLNLYSLLEEKPAEQGGTSYTGLLGVNRDWLLLFERENEFVISVHGPHLFTDMVWQELGQPENML